MPAFARPSADTQINDWTDEADGTTNIYTSINETSAVDTNYVQAASKGSAVYETLLTSVTDPVSSSGHIVRYRYQKDSNAGITINLQVDLYQGGTLIAGQTHNDIPNGWTAGTFTLTGGQADSITNYADLRFIFTPSTTGGGAGRRAQVSWAELEVPSGVATNSITYNISSAFKVLAKSTTYNISSAFKVLGKSTTYAISSAFKQTKNTTLNISSAFKKTNSLTLDISSAFKKLANPITYNISSVFVNRGSLTLDISAVFKKTYNKTLEISSVFKKLANPITYDISAVFVNRGSLTLNISAVFKKTYNKTLDISSVFKALATPITYEISSVFVNRKSTTLEISSVFKKIYNKTLDISSVFKALANSITYDISSVFVNRKSTTYNISSAFSKLNSITYDISSAFKKLNSITYSISAIFVFLRSGSYTIDSVFKKTNSLVYSISAYFEAPTAPTAPDVSGYMRKYSKKMTKQVLFKNVKIPVRGRVALPVSIALRSKIFTDLQTVLTSKIAHNIKLDIAKSKVVVESIGMFSGRIATSVHTKLRANVITKNYNEKLDKLIKLTELMKKLDKL